MSRLIGWVKTVRILEIAEEIANRKLRVLAVSHSGDIPMLCVGEQDWSRCVTVVEDFTSEDPLILLLVDDGRSLAEISFHASLKGGEYAIRLSAILAEGLTSARRILDETRHRNTRLAYGE
jgi:hypothetical protein